MNNILKISGLSILCILIPIVNCSVDGAKELNDIAKTIKDSDIIKNINSDFNTNDIDTEQLIAAGTTAIKEKCLNVSKGNDDAYNNIVNEGKQLSECLNGLVNVTELEIEIEQNSKTGNLEIVFNKYCRKRSIAVECIESFANVTEPCLEKDELEKKILLMEFVKVMFEFVCHKDGDHIAMFIADGGPECFKEHQDELQVCAETFAKRYMTEDGKPIAETPATLSSVNCNDLESLRTCMVNELEKCINTTPGNLVDSMFRQIKKECIAQTNPNSHLTGAGIKISPISATIIIMETVIMAMIAVVII